MKTARLGRLLIGAAGVLLVFLIGVEIYAYRVQAKAQALVESALSVRSTDDAKGIIKEFRKRFGPSFWQESDHPGGQHQFDAQIYNEAAARFRIVQPTLLGISITMKDGELYYVLLLMETGRDSGPLPTDAIWTQEWFETPPKPFIHVSMNRRPWSATVDFGSAVTDDQRRKCFGLRTSCFTKFRACRAADELLPGVWNLAAKDP
jgi:hypothetical protein